MKEKFFRMTIAVLLVVVASVSVVSGGTLSAPPGMFKDLNDQILGDAIIINGKQLFIDDHIIGNIEGAEKMLNQPTKHPGNPLIVPDQPWEEGGTSAYGSVMYDQQEKIFKIWYLMWFAGKEGAKSYSTYKNGFGYAVSKDGITWEKPVINDNGTSAAMLPKVKGVLEFATTVFKDPVETDPQRRYKLFYAEKPDGSDRTLSTSVGYSPDGFRFTAEAKNPVITYADSQTNCYWDSERKRYVAYLRFGPPNKRIVSRIESEDFVHWSPKVTVLNYTKMDDTKAYGWTDLYGMKIMPYDGVYIGLITAYRGETIGKIKKEEEAWRDKINVQLAFSRNGLTWERVGKHGTIDFSKDADWETMTKEATFMPYGRHKVDWDWGQLYTFQKPLVVGDEIWIYYGGLTGRHWHAYHGDTRKSGIGLATLRLDGFVSINAEKAGTVTTKPIVFIGDALEVNANAAGGSIRVEALDEKGEVLEGFSKDDCQPITSDNVRHLLKWKGSEDCHLIQARPVKLRFYMEKAKLYSFTPRIKHKHYIQSYD
jgi:hypothetical protein